MKTLLIDKFPRILKNRKRLEKILGVKIINRGKEVTITGKPEEEYTAEKVIDALNFGFPFSNAISIKESGALFEVIHIKDHTTRKDLKRVRARIIGAKGKALQTLTSLTKCHFELKENDVGIIGDAELIKGAQESLISIIKGSKHSNVYAHLEKHQFKEPVDLGLKSH